MTKTIKKATTVSRSIRKSTRISKTADTKKVTVTKAMKKAPVVKKVNAKSNKPEPKKKERSTTASEKTTQAKTLEVCLLLDETGSMSSWIQRSKETLKGIIENVKKDYAGLKVRVSFVGYRDVQDKPRFEIFEFSEDLDACTKFIAK